MPQITRILSKRIESTMVSRRFKNIKPSLKFSYTNHCPRMVLHDLAGVISKLYKRMITTYKLSNGNQVNTKIRNEQDIMKDKSKRDSNTARNRSSDLGSIW